MTAFLAASKADVETSYLAGLGMRGKCEGKPGFRDHYGEGYYGAYLRDCISLPWTNDLPM